MYRGTLPKASRVSLTASYAVVLPRSRACVRVRPCSDSVCTGKRLTEDLRQQIKVVHVGARGAGAGRVRPAQLNLQLAAYDGDIAA